MLRMGAAGALTFIPGLSAADNVIETNHSAMLVREGIWGDIYISHCAA